MQITTETVNFNFKTRIFDFQPVWESGWALIFNSRNTPEQNKVQPKLYFRKCFTLVLQTHVEQTRAKDLTAARNMIHSHTVGCLRETKSLKALVYLLQVHS